MEIYIIILVVFTVISLVMSLTNALYIFTKTKSNENIRDHLINHIKAYNEYKYNINKLIKNPNFHILVDRYKKFNDMTDWNISNNGKLCFINKHGKCTISIDEIKDVLAKYEQACKELCNEKQRSKPKTNGKSRKATKRTR